MVFTRGGVEGGWGGGGGEGRGGGGVKGQTVPTSFKID